MASKKLEVIARKLVLAEKRLGNIATQKSSIPVMAMPIEIKMLENLAPEIRAYPSIAPSAPIISLNLGKLNDFIKDPGVRAIECTGAGKNIRIRKGQMAEVNVQLTEMEIMDIINKFSNASKIPVSPVFKAAAGNFILNAFMSPALGSKFLITKT